MPENAKKPQIRFKGFTDDWEQRKLGDCFAERNESMPEGELISVTINEGIKKFSELGRHNNSNKDKTKYKKVCISDIAYNSMRMWQGASGYSPYEGIVSPAYTVLVPNAGIDSKCLSYQIKLPYMIHIFQINSQGITSDNWNLKYPVLSQIEIFISKNIEEQRKISNLFDNLDNLITLHQRKLEKLKNIKKSMLEKMFPKNGSNIPEIRFKGFTDAWEQRKLGEIANIVGGGTPSTSISEYWNGDIDWYAPAEMEGKRYANGSAKKITKLGLQNCSAQILPAGRTILFTSRAGIGKMAILKRPGSTNQGFQSLVLNQEINPYFIYSLCDEIKEKAESVAAGSTFLEISGKALGNIEILMPKELEQNKVSNYFLKLDNLITLHQRKLEKLQNIKKACLEKMFV